MNIAFIAKKGGVGKSTMSLLLHESLHHAGKNVAVTDWDVQGTSNKALQMFGGTRALTNGEYDIVLIDTPPNLTHTATNVAIRNADVAIIVTTPSPADIWEADEAVRLVRKKNNLAKVRILFNQVQRGTILARLIKDSTEQLSAPTLSNSVSNRQCYQHALAKGWKALDASAREEILQLTVEILSI